jgi:hypothetical protein
MKDTKVFGIIPRQTMFLVSMLWLAIITIAIIQIYKRMRLEKEFLGTSLMNPSETPKESGYVNSTWYINKPWQDSWPNL